MYTCICSLLRDFSKLHMLFAVLTLKLYAYSTLIYVQIQMIIVFVEGNYDKCWCLFINLCSLFSLSEN
jgi:hypothetical protein